MRVAVLSQPTFTIVLPNTRLHVAKVPKSPKPDIPDPPRALLTNQLLELRRICASGLRDEL